MKGERERKGIKKERGKEGVREEGGKREGGSKKRREGEGKRERAILYVQEDQSTFTFSTLHNDRCTTASTGDIISTRS